MDRIAVIIPVHNRKNTTLNCLRQLQGIKSKSFDLDIIVIDDGSKDGTSDAVLQSYPETKILKGDGNLWWAGAINMGFAYALKNDFDFVYTINDDIEMRTEALHVLYDTLKRKNNSVCSSVCLKILDRDCILYAGYKSYGLFKKFKSPIKGKFLNSYKGKILDVDCLSTRSTLIPIDIIKKVGFLDSKYFPHNYSDFDYFIRVKSKGYSLLVNMDSRIYTMESGSNFHYRIIHRSIKEVLKTFGDIKYEKSLYYLATRREVAIWGHVSFVYKMLPYFFWLVLRVLLPKSIFQEILIKTGRIKDD